MPMETQEAKVVAHGLVENWITKFGCPVNLHNDKVTTFMADLFTGVCTFIGTSWTSAIPLHPDGIEMIKSTIRTTEQILSRYFSENQNYWNLYLQLVTMAYRSTLHTVSKYNPNYLVLGTPLRLPIDFMYETPHTEIFTPRSYVYHLKNAKKISSPCELRDGCCTDSTDV